MFLNYSLLLLDPDLIEKGSYKFIHVHSFTWSSIHPKCSWNPFITFLWKFVFHPKIWPKMLFFHFSQNLFIVFSLKFSRKLETKCAKKWWFLLFSLGKFVFCLKAWNWVMDQKNKQIFLFPYFHLICPYFVFGLSVCLY